MATRKKDKQLKASVDAFRTLISEAGGQEKFVDKLESAGMKRSRSTVAGWMNEKNHTYPDAETLVGIADLFSVSVDWLLGRSEDRKRLDSEFAFEVMQREARLEEDLRFAVAFTIAECSKNGRSVPAADRLLFLVAKLTRYAPTHPLRARTARSIGLR